MRARISLIGLLGAAAISNTVVAWTLGIEDLVEGLADLTHPGAYSPSAADVVRDFLGAMLLGPLGAIFFGIVGAMIFLGPAFLVVARMKGPRSFVAAGCSASLAWITCGVCARILSEKILVLPSWAGWIGFALCVEPFQFRPEPAIAAGVGSLIAGAVAGWVYWWVVQQKSGSSHARPQFSAG